MENQHPQHYFQQLNEPNKQKLRAYEKASIKIIDTINALRFNDNIYMHTSLVIIAFYTCETMDKLARIL